VNHFWIGVSVALGAAVATIGTYYGITAWVQREIFRLLQERDYEFPLETMLHPSRNPFKWTSEWHARLRFAAGHPPFLCFAVRDGQQWTLEIQLPNRRGRIPVSPKALEWLWGHYQSDAAEVFAQLATFHVEVMSSKAGAEEREPRRRRSRRLKREDQ
jgi:hypothetical protein